MEERTQLARFRRPGPKVQTVILILVAILSATLVTRFATSGETWRGAYQKLDEKRNNVIALTAAAAGVATVISLTPDDTGTPIANQLAEISKNFSYVLAAIILEKYLLTATGFWLFALIIPICCVLFAVSSFMGQSDTKRMRLRQIAMKLLTLGLVFFLATPLSVAITTSIDDTYKDVIDASIGAASQLEEEAGAASSASGEDEEKDGESDTGNPVIGALKNAGNAAGSFLKGAVDTVTSVAGKVTHILGNFVETFAVMLVTSIVVPLIVPVLIYLVLKILIGQSPIVAQVGQTLAPEARMLKKRFGRMRQGMGEGTGGFVLQAQPSDETQLAGGDDAHVLLTDPMPTEEAQPVDDEVRE